MRQDDLAPRDAVTHSQANWVLKTLVAAYGIRPYSDPDRSIIMPVLEKLKEQKTPITPASLGATLQEVIGGIRFTPRKMKDPAPDSLDRKPVPTGYESAEFYYNVLFKPLFNRDPRASEQPQLSFMTTTVLGGAQPDYFRKASPAAPVAAKLKGPKQDRPKLTGILIEKLKTEFLSKRLNYDQREFVSNFIKELGARIDKSNPLDINELNAIAKNILQIPSFVPEHFYHVLHTTFEENVGTCKLHAENVAPEIVAAKSISRAEFSQLLSAAIREKFPESDHIMGYEWQKNERVGDIIFGLKENINKPGLPDAAEWEALKKEATSITALDGESIDPALDEIFETLHAQYMGAAPSFVARVGIPEAIEPNPGAVSRADLTAAFIHAFEKAALDKPLSPQEEVVTREIMADLRARAILLDTPLTRAEILRIRHGDITSHKFYEQEGTAYDARLDAAYDDAREVTVGRISGIC